MPKYIYRREIPGEAYSWLVSLLCSPNHDRQSFSDSKHGGKEGALAKAIEYRDRVIKDAGLVLVEDRKIYNNKKTTNSTGVNGVCCSSGYYHAYIYPEPWKRKAKKFSISKWGEELAFQKAVAWRKGMELIIYGQSRIKGPI